MRPVKILNLHWAHMSEGTFSDVAAQMILNRHMVKGELKQNNASNVFNSVSCIRNLSMITFVDTILVLK